MAEPEINIHKSKTLGINSKPANDVFRVGLAPQEGKGDITSCLQTGSHNAPQDYRGPKPSVPSPVLQRTYQTCITGIKCQLEFLEAAVRFGKKDILKEVS